MSGGNRLPQAFLRGLEADLRALCADARRRNPEVKEAAERVILSLKEADNVQSEAEAADEAASAFCAACETLDPSVGSSALAIQVKVVLRAVSCLHKLLTHRALSPARLPEVLDALQRLSYPSLDDNLTLKVLQGLLSLLTVRSYAKSLSEEDLSRAFSLLFILRTSRSSNSGTAASNALSAISQLSTGNDGGVIEQTSKAAFRQVSSDLFASAADSALRTAVEKQAPSGAIVPLSEFPSETRAAYSLFMDLCSAASREDLSWLSHAKGSDSSSVTDLDLAIALEVIDDGLASNISLFAGQTVFSEVLSSRLCPVLHKLLRTTKDKSTMKSLLGLVVTLTRNYWRILQPDCEALLYALTKMSNSANTTGADQVSWASTYAMESLRCIFKSNLNESSALIHFTQAFDLGNTTGKLVGGVVSAACDAMSMVDNPDVKSLPAAPLNGSMKPFANTITNSKEFLIAIATGLYVEIIKAAGEAVKAGLKGVASTLLTKETTERAVALLGKLVLDSPRVGNPGRSRGDDEVSFGALEALAGALGRLSVIATDCELESLRETSLVTLSAACRSLIRTRPTHFAADLRFARRTAILYQVLFDVHIQCRENLRRSWVPVMEALEQLDVLMHKVEALLESEGSHLSSAVGVLKPKLDLVFTTTAQLKWSSCHDMISALVQCSRQSVAAISKRAGVDDQGKTESDSNLRVFGISKAEVAILHAFQRENSDSGLIPCKLWQLLTGHLTSVCTNSGLYSLRQFALNSLTRIACGAVPSGEPPFVGHDKIVTPFLDLFTASHPDVRLGSLSAVHTILVTQGERLTGEPAWAAVLKILSTAAGSKFLKTSGTAEPGHTSQTSTENRVSAAVSGPASVPGIEMMSEAFKVVQVIADDFLSSLVDSTLPVWIDVLGLYSRQDDDINVALTAIGLLWRTADFFAKSTALPDEDGLWVQLFEMLKEISMDDRPEIRNCAVKTLTGALSTHSFRLSALAWNGCAARALLPLLEEVMQGGASSPQHDESALVGKSRGDVQLLMHHSRDTPRKQWNETRVLALAGVAKVLRTAMPRLAVLKDESGRQLFLMLTDGGTEGLWRKMLRAAGVAAGSRDGEVAIAGVSALLELLSAAGFVVAEPSAEEDSSLGRIALSASAPASLGGNNVGESTATSWITGVIGGSESREVDRLDPGGHDHDKKRMSNSTILLWEAVWSALTEAIGGNGSTDARNPREAQEVDDLKIVDEKALQMLAEGLLDARKRLGTKFTSQSSKMLVGVLMYLARGRRTNRDTTETGNVLSLTQVQEVTLRGLQTLSFRRDNESWIGLVQGLLIIIQEQFNTTGNPTILVRRVLKILGHLYAHDELPTEVKKSELSSVLKVVGRIMLLRNESDETSGSSDTYNSASGSIGGASSEKNETTLWVEATEVVMMGMKCGATKGRGLQSEEVWDEFVMIMEEFLYAPQRVQREPEYRRDVAESERAEDYDIRLTGCVQEALCQMHSSTSQKTQRRLVGLLSRGAEEGKASGRARYVRSCQKRLFKLADGVWASKKGQGSGQVDSIAEESNKCVVETCGRVLGQFIADGQRAGRCPLPAARRAEAVFLLQQLRRLNCYEGDGDEGFSKKHLVTLYPRLCECVDSRDEAVRQLARELLDEAAPVGARDRGQRDVRGNRVKT